MAASQSTWQQMVSAGLWKDGEPLRLHLGCGAQRVNGFINIDGPPDPQAPPCDAVDVYVDLLALDFPAGIADEIRFSAGIERLPEGQALELLARAQKWLRPGATLTVGGREPGAPVTPIVPPAEAARGIIAAREARRLAWIRDRAAKVPADARVLDIGFPAETHVELFSHCQYNFFDLRALLESARDPSHRGHYRIPVDDESFDVVMCTTVFEWALHPELALQEVLRALKKDGLLWLAPPLPLPPRDAPPRSTANLGFGWYAAAFAQCGLEIGDAFASNGLFGELCETCLEAGRRLPEAGLDVAQQAGLEDMLLRDLALVFADLETKVPLESPRAAIILEARRGAALPATSAARPPAATGDVAAAPEASVRARLGKRPLRVTYLITSILGVTGGNMTLLAQTEALRRRGHSVSIVTYSPRPSWTRIDVAVIQVPRDQPMAAHVPESDVVVATYFQNAHELSDVSAPIKVYYAQGDQFVFEDDTPFPNRDAERVRQALKTSSAQSYRVPGVHFVANSRNLADAVLAAHRVSAEAVLPVCTDQTMFRPIARAAPGSRQRILVVGPDTRGSGVESLVFKGIGDTRQALELLAPKFSNFTAVRVSNTGADIFQGYPCEFHHVPSDEMKTFLFGTADILVYASHFDSCPRPPQEAMAAGAAVVCTATSGAKEYCVHEENCLLVPIKSPHAIAGAILRFVSDRALRDRMVEGGRRTAAQFPREREWNELEALFYRYAEAAGIA